MKKAPCCVFLVGLAAITLIPLTPRSALACSCASPKSDSAAAEGADAVFAGYVIGAKYPNEVRNVNDTTGEIQWTLLPETIVKGVDEGPVEVLSHSQKSACGVSFKVGRRYLVFAREEDGELKTNYCERTREYYKAVALDGAERVPGSFAPRTPQTSNDVKAWVAVGIGLAPVIAGGVLFLRRRSVTQVPHDAR